ncbi:SfnB family sulfur acquisition oxidoreductase [Conexibacter sp. CPCC 206217]|uniref:SfnB family sulfur acquisition oxidoreductase n=1 Tax=Conexibacter sp. CPCC 206217 TaxID=3064574 RepID=UPI002724DDCE|nr:SfnB family sulfur acquisition oxidoreductase [Conexibacter sp. CPCC 206217]MDO8211680.1 SfnB family sulfur acquisition oxidoreductase [Conexibacter sp. CPCC 206217]
MSGATAGAQVDLSVPDDVRTIASDEEAVAAASAYADAIRPDAVERDRSRRLPGEELRELARTGLLGARVPVAYGGAGVSNATVAEVFRLISAADPAIGQIPQNHFAFVELLVRSGSEAQREFFMPEFLRGARLGNALSERGGRTSRDWVTRLARQPDGSLRLDGRKYYSTGALTAQWIPVFALDDADEVAVAYVPREAPGVTVDQDWDVFGQRATFSGTTTLEGVVVPDEHVVSRALSHGERGDGGERAQPDTFAAFGQLMHVAVDAGIARGALDDGAAFLRERARPWWEADVERAADDPHLLRLAGELDAQVRACEALLASAARALDAADAAPGDLDAITAARLEVAAAKAFAGDTALHVASQIFDVSGSSAADARHGLDRHWRNARTHTLHDPARSKHVHLGRHLVDGVAPPVGHTLV